MVVCTIGDLTLDVLVRLEGALSAGGDTNAEIRFSPGGQAANVAAWAASLGGADVRFLGKRGDDEPGRLARAGLEAAGVEVHGPAEGRNGVICALVAPDGERSMAADRGAGAELRPEEVDPGWLHACDHLFVSGYALLREPTRSAALRAVELARAQEAGISVDLATWSAIRDAGAAEFRGAVVDAAPEVVFATESELEIFGERLADTHWIVKRGARGCVFGDDEHPALTVERVVDTTGAGDALAAGWIVGGPELAMEAAAKCVQRLGSMP